MSIAPVHLCTSLGPLGISWFSPGHLVRDAVIDFICTVKFKGRADHHHHPPNHPFSD